MYTENDLLMVLSNNTGLVIRCLPDVAPNHVKHFKDMAEGKCFDDVPLERVIKGYMAQTGHPATEHKTLKAEFSRIPHTRGIVSAARNAHPDSANGQFFIMTGNNPKLDGSYTVWGQVRAGLQHIDAIKPGSLKKTYEVNGQSMTVSGYYADNEQPIRISALRIIKNIARLT